MSNQDRPNDSAELMNKALLSLYESHLPELNERIEECIEQCKWPKNDVSKLFFMQVDEEYLKASTRILFVGRETHGWWGVYDRLDKAENLMEFYEKVSANGEPFTSPFWWFREKFSQEMGIDEKDFKKGTLWTNLSKIDVNKKLPTGEDFGHLSQVFINLLVEEISIVKPDVVLIMTTGGHYMWHINNYRWLQNEPFTDFKDENQLTRETILPKKIERLIASNRLPEHTYQICHPNTLRWKKGGYNNHANELIQALSHQIKS